MTPSSSHQPVTVRLMNADDVPTVAHWVATVPLWQRYGLTTPKAQSLLTTGLAQGDLLLVADVPLADGRAGGVAWCMPQGAFGRSPYLRLLGVRADLAGQGVGGVLLETLERRLVETADALFLLVSDFNTAAQAFYRRHGYMQAGAIASYVLPEVTELIFWKKLSSAQEQPL